MREPLADSAARLAALSPTQSVIVEAPAGSGKTALLTQRILVLLARVSAPEEVVAITFTRKAAAEMRGRVLDALILAGLPDDPDPHRHALQVLARAVLALDARLNWQLRDNPARLRIQTIDALTAGIVRRLPLLSGLGSATAVRDDASALYRWAARRALLELEQAQAPWASAVSAVLRHLDCDWRRAETLLVEMLARRDQWLTYALTPPSRDEMAVILERVVVRELAAIERLASPLMTALADPGSLADWQALVDLLLTQQGAPRQKMTKHQGVPKTRADAERFQAAFAALVDELNARPPLLAALDAVRRLPSTVYSTTQYDALQAMFTLLRVAAAELRVIAAERGQCDFSEVALAALNALGPPEQPTDLALTLDYSIVHLLVDEFQDTSQIQYALLERLTAGWTGDDGRTLFLVGDPLQSIYRFRDAEVGLFMRTVADARLGNVPLTRLRLSANFRTDPRVLAWLNLALPKVFGGCAVPLPDFHPFSATRVDAPGSGVVIHADAADRAAQVAQLIAVIKATWHEQPTATVAILVRGRNHLGLLPAELLAAGIAVSANEIEPLSAIPVVNDLMSLTRALYAATDRGAWLAVLRAPWCGLSLTSLHTLMEGAPDDLVWECLHDESRVARLASDEQTRLRATREILRQALEWRGRVRYAALVERVWEALNGAACVDPPAHRRFAERYFELLIQIEDDGNELTQGVLTTFISRHFARLPSTPRQAVEIMTIHRAKGLEFDVVLLPELQRTVRFEPKRMVLAAAFLKARGNDILFAPLPPAGVKSEPLYDFLRAQEQAVLAAEAYRGLYVALTRAKRALHLFALPPAADVAPRPGSYLAMLWPVIREHCPPLPAAAAIAPTLPALRYRSRLALNALGHAASPAPRAPRDVGLEFAWASPAAKHVGTVTHLMLERVGSAHDFDAIENRDLGPIITAHLRRLGLVDGELDTAAAQVAQALSRTAASARGRWLFDAEHRERRREYRLTQWIEGQAKDVVLDLTFVDPAGVRWIVDFKTGVHEGGDPEVFMDSEVTRYRAQLERYAAAIRALDTRPVALGLYFPRLDGWREWRFS
ncbi:MAG: UvrD-helicase domain-containing protein [Gammaproteobacteria bacterium]|nr:UvrD-helicase domain-containing protein [Gammaproteobacteria bacterium]